MNVRHTNTYVPYPDDYVPPIVEEKEMVTEHARMRDQNTATLIGKKHDWTPIDHKMADFERRQYEKALYHE